MRKKHILTNEYSEQHLFAGINIQHVFFILQYTRVANRHQLSTQNGENSYNLFIFRSHINTTT